MFQMCRHSNIFERFKRLKCLQVRRMSFNMERIRLTTVLYSTPQTFDNNILTLFGSTMGQKLSLPNPQVTLKCPRCLQQHSQPHSPRQNTFKDSKPFKSAVSLFIPLLKKTYSKNNPNFETYKVDNRSTSYKTGKK